MEITRAIVIIHVLISLVAIAAGFIAMAQMGRDRASKRVTLIFLSMTMLTSLSGFVIPSKQLTPAHILGFLSVAVLAVAMYAQYAKHLTGSWSWIYILTAVLSQYLNVFVLIIQSFQKVPLLRSFDAAYTPLPMALVQVAAATGFIVFTIRAMIQTKGKAIVQVQND